MQRRSELRRLTLKEISLSWSWRKTNTKSTGPNSDLQLLCDDARQRPQRFSVRDFQRWFPGNSDGVYEGSAKDAGNKPNACRLCRTRYTAKCRVDQRMDCILGEAGRRTSASICHPRHIGTLADTEWRLRDR